jgi:hypothetical protein
MVRAGVVGELSGLRELDLSWNMLSKAGFSLYKCLESLVRAATLSLLWW